MVDKKNLLVVEEGLVALRDIQYNLKVKLDCGKNQIIGLIGLGLMNFRKVYRDEVDGVVNNVRNVLGQVYDVKKKEYFEFFEKNLSDGVEVTELDKNQGKDTIVENFLYWFVCLGKLAIGGGEEVKSFSEENQSFWKVFCEKIGICVILDSEKGIHCYGQGEEFAVFYLWKENKDYFLMLGADLMNLSVRKGYSDLFTGNVVVNYLLKLVKKVLSLNKKITFIENTWNLAQKFHLEPEILEYSLSLSQLECDHKYYILYKPFCRTFHCAICLFESCISLNSNEMACSCPKRLSPKNFCELSKLYIKIQKKIQNSSFFTTSNVAVLAHLAQTYCLQHADHYENSAKCSVCLNPAPQSSLFTICNNHLQCKPCLSKDQEKCLFCKNLIQV